MLVAIIATILSVTQWRVVSAPVLKCHGCGLEPQLAGHWKNDSVTGGAGPVCECTGIVPLQGNGH